MSDDITGPEETPESHRNNLSPHPFSVTDSDTNVVSMRGVVLNEERILNQQEMLHANVEYMVTNMCRGFLDPALKILLEEYGGKLDINNALDITLLVNALRSTIYRIHGIGHPLHDYVAADGFYDTYAEDISSAAETIIE